MRSHTELRDMTLKKKVGEMFSSKREQFDMFAKDWLIRYSVYLL